MQYYLDKMEIPENVGLTLMQAGYDYEQDTQNVWVWSQLISIEVAGEVVRASKEELDCFHRFGLEKIEDTWGTLEELGTVTNWLLTQTREVDAFLALVTTQNLGDFILYMLGSFNQTPGKVIEQDAEEFWGEIAKHLGPDWAFTFVSAAEFVHKNA